MQVFIYYKITVHVSGVYRTHYQDYIKLQLQLLVQVISRSLIRSRWLKVVALICDMTCTRSCSCSLM